MTNDDEQLVTNCKQAPDVVPETAAMSLFIVVVLTKRLVILEE